MFFKKVLKQIASMTALSGLIHSTAFAHPGHEVANKLFHGSLHTEHLLVLLGIGVVVAVGKLIKRFF
jgi:hydrogenase/urease accessory protein HupE